MSRSKTGQFKETLKPGQRPAFPIEGLTDEEMHEARSIVEGFFRKKGDPDPIKKANTLLHCAVNCVKVDERGNYYEWLNAPGRAEDSPKSALMKRLTLMSGRGFKQYLNGTPTASPTPKKPPKNKPGPKTSSTNPEVISEHDLENMKSKKKKYIAEFGFDTRPDIALLERLVRIEVVIEKYETMMIVGEGKPDSKIADSVQKLTNTMISLQKSLGITADQRTKAKSQSKEGTVAELFRKYEDTKQEWPEIEQEFMLTELKVLLNKYKRRREDGSREISASVFKRLSRGISVNEAYKLLNRTNPDLYGSEESSE